MNDGSTGDGWDASAEAWLVAQGEHGDFGRRYVLDAPMLERVFRRPRRKALDVGCGEGRFCRQLRARGLDCIGLDPTRRLLEEARRRDPEGDYCDGRAESLPFQDASFDLVIAYLSLIDIAGLEAALAEMSRVLEPGGDLLIANLTGFTSCNAEIGWIRDPDGAPLHFALDRYLEERPIRAEWRGISITNWHRPLKTYISALMAEGLTLAHFDEPAPTGGPAELRDRYNRAPYFVLMEWRKLA